MHGSFAKLLYGLAAASKLMNDRRLFPLTDDFRKGKRSNPAARLALLKIWLRMEGIRCGWYLHNSCTLLADSRQLSRVLSDRHRPLHGGRLAAAVLHAVGRLPRGVSVRHRRGGMVGRRTFNLGLQKQRERVSLNWGDRRKYVRRASSFSRRRYAWQLTDYRPAAGRGDQAKAYVL